MNIKPFILGCLLLIGILSRFASEPGEQVKVTHLSELTMDLSDVKALEDVKAPEAVETIEEGTEAPEPKMLDPVEVELIGRTIWGEAEGVKDKAERAAVAWCILNRVDAYGQTIEEVVTAPRQFHGYRPKGECPQSHLDLAADVLARWYAEKDGAEEVGRVLPADYLYFVGDGERNHFSIEWRSSDFWDWSLTSPYIVNQAETTANE